MGVETSVLFKNLPAKMKASMEVLYDRIPNIKSVDYKMYQVVISILHFNDLRLNSTTICHSD